MVAAHSSRAQVTYAIQPDFKVNPTTPEMIVLPVDSGGGLSNSKAIIDDNQINNNRQRNNTKHGNKNAIANFPFQFRADDYDALLESALFSTFQTNVLSVGATPLYFVIQEAQLDIDQYRQAYSMLVNTLTLSFVPGDYVRGTVDFIGRDYAQAQTSLDATPTPASGNDIFDNVDVTITEAGSVLAIATGFELNINNGVSPIHVVGTDLPECLNYSDIDVSGTFSILYQDETLIDKFLDETATDINIAISSSITGDTYTFVLPNVSINAESTALNKDETRIVEFEFAANYDSVADNTLTITKS